jgi:hypothetical protein
MTVRWITPFLGTAAALDVRTDEGTSLIDVRDLVDKGGNEVDAVRQKIAAGVAALQQGRRTIVACDYGISRSNAVATGILAKHEGLPFSVAARRVIEATGEREIKLGPLEVVRVAVGEAIVRDAQTARRALVTGPNGSIGRALLPALSHDFDVIALPRSDADLQQGSTLLDLVVSERSPGFIVHLANPRIYSSTRALGETLTLMRNVLDVCVSQNVHLLYLSGWEVYSGYRSRVQVPVRAPDRSLQAYARPAVHDVAVQSGVWPGHGQAEVHLQLHRQDRSL